jgi:hypothetical protein
MAPLLLIAVAVAGVVFGREASQNQILSAIGDLVGVESARAIQVIIESAGQKPDSGFLASAIGMIFLLLGAAGVVEQLQDSLNTIWRVVPKTGRGILGFFSGSRGLLFHGIERGLFVTRLIGHQRSLNCGVGNHRRLLADRRCNGAHFRSPHLICVYHIPLRSNLQIRARRIVNGLALPLHKVVKAGLLVPSGQLFFDRLVRPGFIIALAVVQHRTTGQQQDNQ